MSRGHGNCCQSKKTHGVIGPRAMSISFEIGICGGKSGGLAAEVGTLWHVLYE